MIKIKIPNWLIKFSPINLLDLNFSLFPLGPLLTMNLELGNWSRMSTIFCILSTLTENNDPRETNINLPGRDSKSFGNLYGGGTLFWKNKKF